MNEIRIYTLKMTRYLTELGFRYKKIVQDVKNPQFYNWIYEGTPELFEAIERFKTAAKATQLK